MSRGGGGIVFIIPPEQLFFKELSLLRLVALPFLED